MSSRKRTKKKADIRVERKDAEDKYQKHMDKLWKILASATPEQQKEIIANLDEKTTYLLRTRKNIYNKPVYKGHKVERLAFNIINLREKYLQRFSMTSLIGFVYRMLDEWKPPGHKDFTSQDDPEFSKLFNAKSKVLERTRPIEICESNIEFLSKKIEIINNTIKAADEPDSDIIESQVDNLKKSKKKRYQEIFVWNTKLIKYKIAEFVRIKDPKKLKMDFAITDYDRARQIKELHEKRLVVLKKKISLREKFEGSAEHTRLKEAIKTRDSSSEPTFESELDEALIDPKKTRLSAFDKEQTLKNFQKILTGYEKNVEISNTDVETLAQKSKLYKKEYQDLVSNITDLNEELTNLKIKYNKHFGAPVAKIPISNALKSKKKAKNPVADVHILDDIKIKEYEITDSEYDTIVDEVKAELNIDTTKEEWVQERQDTVQSFLDEYFLYNPDNHVQCAYKPNYDDDLRTPLRTAWRDFHNGEMTETQYDQALADQAKNVERYRVITEEEYERSVIPPDDSFFRWQRYIDNNYEELRQATDDIYCEKSDVEWSVVPLKHFSGRDKKEVEVESNEWKRKYAEEFEGDVLFATFGVHNMLGSWEQNREARDFYNKNSEVIKQIIDQNKDDQRMGRRLMKQRTETVKRDNVAEAGPDAAGLKSYMEGTGSSLKTFGAKHADDLDNEESSIQTIGGRELDGLNRMDESNKQEIEVGFTHIRPRKRHGKFRATQATQGKFHIPAEDHLPETGVVMKPSDVQKKIMGDQLKASLNQ